jgi:hypothetical protein
MATNALGLKLQITTESLPSAGEPGQTNVGEPLEPDEVVGCQRDRHRNDTLVGEAIRAGSERHTIGEANAPDGASRRSNHPLYNSLLCVLMESTI